MPIPITDYSENTAASELGKAGIAGLWLGISTEAGGRLLGKGLSGVGGQFLRTEKGGPFGRYPVAGPITAAVGRGLYRGGKFLTGVGRQAASIYGGGTLRDIATGGIHGATQAASWLYRHPVSTAAIAGGFGIAEATLDPNQRLSNEVSMSPGIVESMGGTSSAGTQQLMQMMNANGNIVLGAHNRR